MSTTVVEKRRAPAPCPSLFCLLLPLLSLTLFLIPPGFVVLPFPPLHLRLSPFPSGPPKHMKSMHLGEREQFRRVSAFPSYTEPSRAGSQLAGRFWRQDVIGSFSDLVLKKTNLKSVNSYLRFDIVSAWVLCLFPLFYKSVFFYMVAKKKMMTFVLVRLRHALERQGPDLFRVER